MRADSIKESNNEVEMQFSASGLPDKATCLCGSNDPFCVISRMIHHQEWVKVHVTDTIRGKTNPVFNRIKMPMAQLCNADKDAPVKFELYSERANGSHVYYGEFITCVAELQNGQRSFQLKNERLGGSGAGFFRFEHFQLVEKPSFIDYLRSGWLIKLSTSIDFTASNGEITEQNSLHYMDPSGQKMNNYEEAILAVGKILENYDYNR